jgi:hypothetical protein
MTEILLILTLLLSLPMPVGDTKLEGWPALATTEHLASTKEVGDACQIGHCGVVMGCARFDLDRKTCDIWVSNENPSWPNVLEHERLHCQGYAHRNNLLGCGGDDMNDYFERWKSSHDREQRQ